MCAIIRKDGVGPSNLKKEGGNVMINTRNVTSKNQQEQTLSYAERLERAKYNNLSVEDKIYLAEFDRELQDAAALSPGPIGD